MSEKKSETDRAKPYQVMLNQARRDKAKKIGKGNFSKGVQDALDNYALTENKGVKND